MSGFPYERIVFLYGGRACEPVNRSQQLARCFAARVPVLYAPYGSLRQWVNREWLTPPWKPLVNHERIETLRTPFTVFLGRRYRLPGQINGRIVAARIRARLRQQQLPLEVVLFFCYTPVGADVLRHFPEAAVHYDCADDHEHWHGSTPAMSRLNRENEIYVAQRARTITASASALERKMRAYNPNVTLVPNGVEYELFASPSDHNHGPAELEGLSRPLLGFIGAAQGYVDVELVTGLAEANVGTLVFVGPLARLQQKLQGHRNVRFLGHRDYATLPQYLQSFDVTIIPANRAPASLTANPGKLYQYLASGKPVVATDLPEFLPHSDIVYLARTTEEFIAQVREALREPLSRRAARQSVAAACSWPRRAEMILAAIQTHSLRCRA